MTNKTIDETVEKCTRHIFVKYGSSIIGEKIGNVEDEFKIKYIHMHDGCKPEVENRKENYNKNMKIKSCVIYKFDGDTKKFEALCKTYNNLEIITDKN